MLLNKSPNSVIYIVYNESFIRNDFSWCWLLKPLNINNQTFSHDGYIILWLRDKIEIVKVSFIVYNIFIFIFYLSFSIFAAFKDTLLKNTLCHNNQ